MIWLVYDNATGLPEFTTQSPTPPNLSMIPGDVAVIEFPEDEEQDRARVNINSDPRTIEFADRIDIEKYPDVAQGPFSLLMQNGWSVAVTELGAGQSVKTSDPNDPITLSTPGRYLIEVEPKWPEIAFEQEIRINA